MDDPIINGMSQEAKEWFARAVVGMMWADGRIDQAEISYFKGLLGFLKDANLLNSVLSMIKENRISTLEKIELEQQQSLSILKHLTSISIVDEELTAAEEKYLKHVATQLHQSEQLADKLIELAKKRLKGNRFPARLTISDDSLEISCFGFTEKECLFFSNRQINPLARLTISLCKDSKVGDASGYFSPLIADSQWCRAVKSNIGKYVAKASFRRPLGVEEGAFLVLTQHGQKESVQKGFEPKYNSMMGFYLQCRVCGEKNIPAWQLRTRTLHSKQNIFGIPCYDRSLGDKQFCDYNLFQVSVCPSCYFASNQMEYFQRQGQAIGVSMFNVRNFAPGWKASISQREILVGENSDWLRSDNRTVGQAYIAYQLAQQTHDQLALISNEEERIKHQRKSISFLLTLAEVLMNSGERVEAESILSQVNRRLEEIFPGLAKESAIRAAFLRVMIQIYFKRYDEVGELLNYLDRYASVHKVIPGSEEYKALNTAIHQTKEAWQSRKEYSRDHLKVFHVK